MLLSAVLLAALSCSAAIPLKDGDRIAVIGDSITEQKLYSVYMEFYLRACSGLHDLSVIQFGHGGEHASSYAVYRMKDTCSWFNPTVATLCYGMNDGQYRKVNDRSSANYRNGLRKIASWMNQNHIRLLISSPGAVDTATFRRLRPDDYNQTLAVLGGIAKETAAEFHAEFADLHSLLLDVMRKAKAKYGESYHVCGADGIHPARNGHLVMAYSMLKGLGMDGKIAEIKMDYPPGKHRVRPVIRWYAVNRAVSLWQARAGRSVSGRLRQNPSLQRDDDSAVSSVQPGSESIHPEGDPSARVRGRGAVRVGELPLFFKGGAGEGNQSERIFSRQGQRFSSGDQ